MIMRNILVLGLQVFLASSAWAASFIELVDDEQYESAAKLIDQIDQNDPGVARRLGVMYYKAKGVPEDKAKGIALLENAMISGDSIAAINLVKIYYKAENDIPKAAWCLMLADTLNDKSVREDVDRMKNVLGSDYTRNVITYIDNLRRDLENGKTSLIRAETSLKRLESLIDKERGDFKIAKDGLDKQLQESLSRCSEYKDEIYELNEELETANTRIEEYEKQLTTINAKLENVDQTKNDISNRAESLEKTIEENRSELALSSKLQDKLRKDLQALQKTYSALSTDYNALRVKHESLSKEHDELLVKYDVLQIELMKNNVEESEDNGLVSNIFSGVGRGASTVVHSPLNFKRAFKESDDLAYEMSKEVDKGYAHTVAYVSLPLLLGIQLVPTILDFANGTIDIATLGMYGNLIYRNGITPFWQDK